eukprot:2436288-Alexandrium_andersonii.AAC.1
MSRDLTHFMSQDCPGSRAACSSASAPVQLHVPGLHWRALRAPGLLVLAGPRIVSFMTQVSCCFARLGVASQYSFMSQDFNSIRFMSQDFLCCDNPRTPEALRHLSLNFVRAVRGRGPLAF